MTARNFFLNLIRRHRDVGIVLGKLAHPRQTVQDSGSFMTMDRTQFKITDRQLPITAELSIYR